MVKFNEKLSELVYDDKIKEFCNDLKIKTSMFYKCREGASFPSLTNAIKIAEYFGYSLDFVLGRSDDDRKMTFKPCANFAERLKAIMKEKKTNPYRLSNDAHIGRKTIYQWLNGTTPTVPSIIVLANAFDCSADYLLGRE